MKSILLLISLYSHPGPLHLMDTVLPRNKNYNVKLINQNAQAKFGYLVNVDDSTISLANVPLPKRGPLPSGIITSKYAYPNITSIRLERKGVLQRSLIWGTVVGLAVGTIAGFASGDDPKTPETGNPFTDIFIGIDNAFKRTASEKALLYGLSCSATGAIIGILAGVLSKKKFIINGKKEPFDAMRNSLLNDTADNPSTD